MDDTVTPDEGEKVMQETEAVEEPSPKPSDDSTPSDGSGAMVIMNLESMIKSHISQLDNLRSELDKHASMLKDIFDNDPTYKEHSERAKEAAKIKSATKAQILKQPQAADLNEKVKSFKSQIKETEDALSDYLGEYQRMTGVNEIEGEDGEVREIVYVPKLVKKSSLYR